MLLGTPSPGGVAACTSGNNYMNTFTVPVLSTGYGNEGLNRYSPGLGCFDQQGQWCMPGGPSCPCEYLSPATAKSPAMYSANDACLICPPVPYALSRMPYVGQGFVTYPFTTKTPETNWPGIFSNSVGEASLDVQTSAGMVGGLTKPVANPTVDINPYLTVKVSCQVRQAARCEAGGVPAALTRARAAAPGLPLGRWLAIHSDGGNVQRLGEVLFGNRIPCAAQPVPGGKPGHHARSEGYYHVVHQRCRSQHHPGRLLQLPRPGVPAVRGRVDAGADQAEFVVRNHVEEVCAPVRAPKMAVAPV